MNQNGTVTSYTYDANNRLLGETTNGITTPFTYDADGNMLATVAQTDTAHIFEDGTCRLCEDLQTYRLGDLNLDGEISLVDVLGVLKLCDSSSAQAETALLSAVSAETISADSADLNGNGVLDTEDYMLFLQGLLGDAIAPATLYATEEKSDVRTDAWAAFADLDGNGIVEGADYSIALTVMSAPTPHLTDRMARLIADVNGDGVVNRTDAVDLTSYLTNGDSPYPIDTVVSNTTYCPITKAYTYNARNQQTHFNTADVSASYAYNPNGLRNIKTVGGSTKYFVYNGMNIVYEYSESVADGIAYFYGLNRTHNSEGEIYVYNAHGDVVQLVKDNSVVASYTYDAFGNLTSQIGESDNPFLYCGEYYDAETQTYYLRARYYNPANGRFTQQDAWAFMDISDPLSLNLYTYCYNNPISYIDYSGNFVISVLAASIIAGAVIGGVLGGVSGYAKAKSTGATNKQALQSAAYGAVVGSLTGALLGMVGGYTVTAFTGVAAISISASGVAVVSYSSPWLLDAFTRGYELERAFGGMCNNFPTIDKFTEVGNHVITDMTSIKSMDLSTVTYQTGNTVYNTLMAYGQKLLEFNGTKYANNIYTVSSNALRHLELIIPPGATAAQLNQISRAAASLKELGVELFTRIVQ